MQTGRGLRSFDSVELHSIASFLLIESSQQTEEEAKARDSAISSIRRIDREAATGMPAVTELYRPADEMYD